MFHTPIFREFGCIARSTFFSWEMRYNERRLYHKNVVDKLTRQKGRLLHKQNFGLNIQSQKRNLININYLRKSLSALLFFSLF